MEKKRLRLKELCFYMDGKEPMVRVVHHLEGGVEEIIQTKASELGDINDITVKLATAIVKKVKKNV